MNFKIFNTNILVQWRGNKIADPGASKKIPPPLVKNWKEPSSPSFTVTYRLMGQISLLGRDSELGHRGTHLLKYI